MSNRVVFETVRPWLDEQGYTPERIDQLNEACEALRAGLDDLPITVVGKRQLEDEDAFFANLRDFTGALSQTQVDTVNGLLAAAAQWPLSWLAYGLATAWHEAKLKPIEEYGRGKGRRYGKPGKYKQSQHGRGLVQLTWDENYEWADKALGLGGSLLKNFNRALEPDIATRILVKGMEEGAFARDEKGRHSLTRYLPVDRPARLEEFAAARRIINGTDRADKIAAEAVKFQAALTAGGWG